MAEGRSATILLNYRLAEMTVSCLARLRDAVGTGLDRAADHDTFLEFAGHGEVAGCNALPGDFVGGGSVVVFKQLHTGRLVGEALGPFFGVVEEVDREAGAVEAVPQSDAGR